jgi:hypothetical protein
MEKFLNSDWGKKIESVGSSMFYLDKRSLALFRILLALANLVCAYHHLAYGDALIGENGVQPPDVGQRYPYHYSLFFINHSDPWTYSIFIVWVVSAVLFGLGIKPRIFSLILLIITISVENRFIVSGGTVGLRLGLLWSLFLPIADIKNPLSNIAPWFHKLLKNPSAKPHDHNQTDITKIVSIPSICFVLKMCMVYWVAFFQKDYNEWVSLNTPLYNSLWHGGLATELGVYLREFPTTTKLLTILTYMLEAIGPVLLLCPWKNGLLRFISCCLFAGMHIGIEATMGLEEFPYANFAIITAFLPTSFWDTINKINKRQQPTSLVNGNKKPPNSAIEYSFRIEHTIILILFLLVSWKNLANFKLCPPPNQIANITMSILKIQENWSMFKGGDKYYTFWPIVIATTQNGKSFDIWKWFINLEDPKDEQSNLTTQAEDAWKLSPNLRWEKFLTGITAQRGYYKDFQIPFLKYLAEQYNKLPQNQTNPVIRITLSWGWREILDIGKFAPPYSGELTTYKVEKQ